MRRYIGLLSLALTLCFGVGCGKKKGESSAPDTDNAAAPDNAQPAKSGGDSATPPAGNVSKDGDGAQNAKPSSTGGSPPAPGRPAAEEGAQPKRGIKGGGGRGGKGPGAGPAEDKHGDMEEEDD